MIAALLLALLPCAQDADSHWSAGRRAEAIEAATAALTRAPGDETLRRKLVGWEMAVHRYTAAIEHMEPLGTACEALRGEALYHLADYEHAVQHLSDADPEQTLMLVDAFEALSRFGESDAALEKARERLGQDDPRVLGCDGRRFARLQRWPEAIAAFRGALAKDALDGEALFGLGRALVQHGRKDEGLRVLTRHRELAPLLRQVDFARRAVDLAPNHAPNWTAVGDAERAIGRLDAAEEAYRKAASLASPVELVPNALRHARLLAEDRKDVARAIEMLAGAAERAPDARLWVRIGDLHRDAGRKSDAIAAYERALVLRPKDVEIQKRLAEAQKP